MDEIFDALLGLVPVPVRRWMQQKRTEFEQVLNNVGADLTPSEVLQLTVGLMMIGLILLYKLSYGDITVLNILLGPFYLLAKLVFLPLKLLNVIKDLLLFGYSRPFDCSKTLQEGLKLGEWCNHQNDCGVRTGFERICKSNTCQLDFNEFPLNFREATDQKYCDCAAAIATAHAYDDRRVLFERISVQDPSQLTTIDYHPNCVRKQIKHDACEGAGLSQTIDLLINRGTKSKCQLTKERNFKEPLCFSSAEQMRREFEKHGPLIHHFKVYDVMFQYPNIHNRRHVDILRENDIHGSELGYTTFEVAGFGKARLGKSFQTLGDDWGDEIPYVLIKTSWGPRYGHEGYLKVTETALERLLPGCEKRSKKKHKYDDKFQHKLPFSFFSTLQSKELNNDLPTWVKNARDRRMKGRHDESVQKINYDYCHHCSNNQQKLQKYCKDRWYGNGYSLLKLTCFSIVEAAKVEGYNMKDTIHADLTIVQGGKVHIIASYQNQKNYRDVVYYEW
eukprot:CAMPEP_0204825552 /NCGR_PEP_ID=MMETSP1346-20131115/3424_1 /ASSEMBLY_ACC=CAM_ASM_000771 /TAXON_ID=215587 /ORGANISM="Aplanochytrium stocchinoi, Strain GSBS06" /LENGTH=503 /DNA_ID=CAMNT_0051953219 /DNA_START=130 /DNA_END=1638 /DNA_ORIENTATION=+